ncbi:hypothetical protein [Halobacillus mangrovi]|uniref:hypothetical protein n=1 Tax=Halobacillus mangrovi TaxID=402384 RepID=UPI003D981FC4
MYYSRQPYYTHLPYWHNNGYWPRQYPPVDPSLLCESAKESKVLMKEASMVLDKLAESEEFDAQLMYAAQASDIQEVKRLINSIGVTSDVDVTFNPDGLRLEFKSQGNMNGAKLSVALRWR